VTGHAARPMSQRVIPNASGHLEWLTRRTEGWRLGSGLAAISMGTHPHGDQFVKELTGKDSALIDPGTDGFELEVGRQ